MPASSANGTAVHPQSTTQSAKVAATTGLTGTGGGRLAAPQATQSAAMAATMAAASNVTSTSADLSGWVTPGGLATSSAFQYGPSNAHGLSAGASTTGPWYWPQAVATTVSGLLPGTTYHVELLANNLAGAFASQDVTFTTLSRPATPVGISGSWSMIFDDEFSTSALDAQKWSTARFGSGITVGPNVFEQECYDPSQVSVTGGILALDAISRTETCGGAPHPFASGLVSTNGKFAFTYGAMEARIWMPGTADHIDDWPAFWADGQRWPYDGEIDVVEGLGGRSCFHFHYSGGGPGGCATINGGSAGWHTYAADWEPGEIAFYYDGHLVGQQLSGLTDQPMYLTLDLAVSSTTTTPDVAPSTMRVDYVRVWQH